MTVLTAAKGRAMNQNANPNEFMVVYVASSDPEAHIVAGRLQSEGIPTWVHQEPVGSAYGITVGPLGEVRVLVRSDDYERALAILEQDPDTDTLLPDADDMSEDDNPIPYE